MPSELFRRWFNPHTKPQVRQSPLTTFERIAMDLATIKADVAAIKADADAESNKNTALRNTMTGIARTLIDIKNQLANALAANAPQDGELQAIHDQLGTIATELTNDAAADDAEMAPPVIASINPTSGKTGDIVTITGTNLTGLLDVSVGDVLADFSTNKDDAGVVAISFPVPAQPQADFTGTQPIKATNAAGDSNTDVQFTYA